MPSPCNSTSGMFEAEPGVFLYYEVSGNCSTHRSILLLHGFGASTEDWIDVRDQLGEEACVVSLDLKGHGRSSRPRDGDYSLDTQSDLLLTFISSHCLSNTVLIGHSYGGAVALLAVVKAQMKGTKLPISALVLVDVPGYPQPVPAFLRVLYMPIIGRLVSLIPSRMAMKFSLRKAFYDHRKISPAIVSRYASAMDRPGSHYALALAAKGMLPNDLSGYLAGLGKIELPTLILWGDHDRIVPSSVGARLKKDIAGSSLQFVQNCGHVPQEEQPDEFLALLKAFLRTVPDLTQ